MEHTSSELQIIRMIQRGKDIDTGLPYWARRSNPIVRRELGMAWRTMLPEVGFLRQAFIIQTILVALTLPFPFLIELALPTVTAAIILLPFAAVVYARVLVIVSSAGARSMTNELQNDTLNVLRTTPFTLTEIIVSKASAAMWRQIEDLGLLMLGVALLSTPLLISYYGTLWPLDQNPVLARVAIVLGLGVSIIRMLLEPFMVAMIGVLMGTALRTRSAGTSGTLVVGAFYFLCINLFRLVHMSWPMRFVVDFVLPLALPILIMGLVIWLTTHLIERE
ncbi:MAG: hypothetical protein GC179_13395 [Anaerolineaceae bacterium]|nr:hypothetical protein [Anaerolineaceae bacterium]